MASSSNDDLSLSQTLISEPVSAEQTRLSDPEPVDDAIVGDKRKRSDEENDDKSGAERSDSTLHPLWKTSLCSYFRRHGASCSHGSACRYAHGEGELRQRPDGTWDPTSERAKKVMRMTEDAGKCEEEEEEDTEILITEQVMDDDADDDGNGGNGNCVLDPSLSKCLVHTPIRWHTDDLKKFLRDQGVQFKFAKKKKGMAVSFVTFENAEHLQSGVEILEGKSVGNKKLKIADCIPRSCDKNIKSAMESGAGDSRSSNDAVKVKSAREAVTPLAHLSYPEQLEQKRSSIMQMLKKLTRNARKACSNGISLPEWVLKSREIGGLPCNLEGVMESPVINGYRNKCEFSIGYSVQGKLTAGFMLGNFREGVTAVEEPLDCPNISRIACKYASIFQEFLQNSTFPSWNRFKNCGFWRQLTVREGRKPGGFSDVADVESSIAEVMLIVQVCTSGFDDAKIASEFERMAKAFAEGARANSPLLPLTALVIQDHQGISNVAPADAPLRSLLIPMSDNGSNQDQASNVVTEARIHDYINNLRFSISPTAFFQVNTIAAEKLYSLAGDWAGLDPDTLLFDICCGTGTIGLTLAHRVGMVVGIEMNASAVSDAEWNAKINGISNCKFICSKAEDVMGSLLKEYLDVPPEEEPELPTNPDDGNKDDSSDVKETPNPEHENGKNLPESLGKDQEELQENEHKSPSAEAEKSSKPQFRNVVAIVDPPRSGLHPIVIKALRTHPRLRRLVYISCNPETLVANAIELCTPSPDKAEKGNKDNRGWRKMSSAGLARHRAKSMPASEPFRPIKAMAVDLFPHTHHCEMVMLLER
ncbi:PREDICTED: zinc finger CCCH domain-containing protein 24 [Tarenaya hassleriana]|uniref:zinc finger CCCH domain-containing protein 24 n=1 Tax=Tarenaya hassleriana TaxID=28532 RepID=UPI00053C6BC3|nr:PREDICTED: zinc finger CCCH domain-containing protein 24 [Tarenaya hassleriana]